MSKGELKAIQRETGIQTRLNHKNIIKMYNNFEKDGKYYIILELAENGNLFEYSHKNTIPVAEVLSIFKQLVSAVNHLHKLGILHRDIKPENVLFTKDMTVKLCDFGFCAPYGKLIRR